MSLVFYVFQLSINFYAEAGVNESCADKKPDRNLKQAKNKYKQQNNTTQDEPNTNNTTRQKRTRKTYNQMEITQH